MVFVSLLCGKRRAQTRYTQGGPLLFKKGNKVRIHEHTLLNLSILDSTRKSFGSGSHTIEISKVSLLLYLTMGLYNQEDYPPERMPGYDHVRLNASYLGITYC